jgi:hypothetical protein
MVSNQQSAIGHQRLAISENKMMLGIAQMFCNGIAQVTSCLFASS